MARNSVFSGRSAGYSRDTRTTSGKATDLRVVSGKFRGRSIKSPANSSTHPMGAREKLALFNMVAVDGLKILDAYAGSGALGIEALSRDAKEVVFVESSPKVARLIRENLGSILGSDVDLGSVFAMKMANFAQNPEYQEYFDVILADPPYDNIDIAELQMLETLLADGGILALSSPAKIEPIELNGLRVSSTHIYARARITIYRK